MRSMSDCSREGAAGAGGHWHDLAVHFSWSGCREGVAAMMHMCYWLLCSTWVWGDAAGLLSR